MKRGRRKLKKGYLFTIPNSRYIQMAYAHPLTGKYIRKSTKTTDEYRAQELMDKEIHEAWDKNNLDKKDVGWTVDELLDWAMTMIWQTVINPDQLKYALMRIRATFGSENAALLSEKAIIKFHSGIIKEGLSIATAIRPLGYLSAAYRAAIHCKELSNNPVANVRALNPSLFDESTNKRTKFLDIEDQRALLDLITGTLELLVRIALRTGMRQGEILRLEWDDIDYRNMQLHTWSQKGRSRKKKHRYIPIMPEVKKIFDSLPHYGKFVFSYPDGSPLSRNGVVHSSYRRVIQKLAEIRPIFKGKFTFHDLRHTFASDWLNRGLDKNVLQEILGHSNAEMTERYGHLAKKTLFVEMSLLPSLPLKEDITFKNVVYAENEIKKTLESVSNEASGCSSVG